MGSAAQPRSTSSPFESLLHPLVFFIPARNPKAQREPWQTQILSTIYKWPSYKKGKVPIHLPLLPPSSLLSPPSSFKHRYSMMVMISVAPTFPVCSVTAASHASHGKTRLAGTLREQPDKPLCFPPHKISYNFFPHPFHWGGAVVTILNKKILINSRFGFF